MMSNHSEFHQFNAQLGANWLSTDLFWVNFQYGYLGQPDWLGWYCNQLTLIELKTVMRPKRPVWLNDDLPQLAAYWTTLESEYELNQAALVYYCPEVNSLQTFSLSFEQMQSHKRQWLHKIKQFRQKIRGQATCL